MWSLGFIRVFPVIRGKNAIVFLTTDNTEYTKKHQAKLHMKPEHPPEHGAVQLACPIMISWQFWRLETDNLRNKLAGVLIDRTLPATDRIATT